jgi:methyl-accepting chemotaxis protein
MKSIYDLKIGTRLLAAFIIVGAITAAVGLMGVASIAKIANSSRTSYEQETIGIAAIKQANIDLIEVDRAVKNILLSNSTEEREEYKARAEAYTGLVNDDLDKAKPLIHTDKGKELLTQAEQAWKENQDSTSQVIALAMADKLEHKRASVELSFGAARAKSDAAEDALAAVVTLKEDVAKQVQDGADKTYRTNRTLLIILSLTGVLVGLGLGVYISRGIATPLGLIAAAARNIALGNVNQKIEYRSGDEVGVLAESFRAVIDAVNTLTRDAFMLSEAAVQGKLATRADASKHQGDFRKIVEGVNRTIATMVGYLDSMPAPAMIVDREFNIQYMNTIGANVGGKQPAELIGTKCYDHFKTGDCRTDACACHQAISRNQTTASETVARAGGVELDIAYNAIPIRDEGGQVIGAFEIFNDQTEVKKAARMAQKVADYQAVETQKLGDGLVRLAQGDTTVKVDISAGDADTAQVRKTFETLAEALNTCVHAVNSMVADANTLSQAAVEGKLTTRADATRHQGDYRKIIQGVNDTLDATVLPITECVRILGQISGGNLREKVEIDCKGDLEKMKNAVNGLHLWLNELIEFVTRIANGDLAVSMAKASEQDQIHPWLRLLKQNIKALATDAEQLAVAAVAGKLDYRADASKHQGEYRKIIEGVNETLDAVIVPLHKAADYVDRIGKGDIPAKITDSYNGDFNTLKHNINACIDGLGGLVEANKVLQRMAANDYTVNVEGSYQGVFAEVAKATNDAQDRIKHATFVVEKIGAGDFHEELVSFQKIGKRSANDMLVPAFIQTMSSIEALVADADMLAKAAAGGRVGVRADVNKQHGDYRKVIEGMNHTLEAIVEPLRATAENASSLASSSEELTAVSQQMASSAEETATQANVVSAASEQVSRNVASVATAAEEMQASIREISKNANDSARVAKNAVGVAQSTNDTMKKLGESSLEIGNVIKVITSIAQQTNLLALNATIEAARAGEAGKGFAVVANEVKELAKQTANATEEISQKIEGMQGVTKGAVSAIEEIGGIINQINDISNSIASAVEEQTVTTNEIGRSVTEAAQGVNDIARNIGGVATAARNTTNGANDTRTASLELSEMAARLQAAVSKFTF